MLAAVILAFAPLLVAAAPPGCAVLIESVVSPGDCVQIQTFNPPRDGLTVYLGQCDGGGSKYAHSTFFAPEVDTPGPIYYNDEFCLVPSDDPAVDAGRIFLGFCDKQWTIKADGTISTANGQCLNYDDKQFKLQTYTCDPTGKDQATSTSP